MFTDMLCFSLYVLRFIQNSFIRVLSSFRSAYEPLERKFELMALLARQREVRTITDKRATYGDTFRHYEP